MAAVLEATMLVCFGLSWPLNAAKSWKAATAVGSSWQFIALITAGYLAGIGAKLLAGPLTWVIAVYLINLAALGANWAVYFRNRRLDRARKVNREWPGARPKGVSAEAKGTGMNENPQVAANGSAVLAGTARQGAGDGAGKAPAGPGQIALGLKGFASELAVEALSARAMRSGSPDVYATPALIALVEEAALKSVADRLAEGETTVGTRIELFHLAATPIGMNVRAEAELVAVDGRKLSFEFRAYDESGLVGKGTHERFIVNEARFQEKANAKLG